MKYLFRLRDQNKSQEIKKCLELHRSKMAKLHHYGNREPGHFSRTDVEPPRMKKRRIEVRESRIDSGLRSCDLRSSILDWCPQAG
jgi:hypothetical protein